MGDEGRNVKHTLIHTSVGNGGNGEGNDINLWLLFRNLIRFLLFLSSSLAIVSWNPPLTPSSAPTRLHINASHTPVSPPNEYVLRAIGDTAENTVQNRDPSIFSPFPAP